MTDNSELQTSTTPTKPKKGFFGYAWRTILWFLVALYFALGAWLGARYCLAPYLNEHKSKIENKISHVLDIPVQFGSLDTDWQGLSPEITLKNIELGEPGKDPITAESLTAKLSLSSLTNLTPIFESVTLNNPKVEVRRLAPMSFSVLGRKVNLKKLMSGETETHALTTKLPSDVMLLLKQKYLEIKDGTILIHESESCRCPLISRYFCFKRSMTSDGSFVVSACVSVSPDMSFLRLTFLPNTEKDIGARAELRL